MLLKVNPGSNDISRDILALVDELASISPKITVEQTQLPRTASFRVNRVGEDTGVNFAGIPLGQEFTSLVIALLQVSGRSPKVDQKVIDSFAYSLLQMCMLELRLWSFSAVEISVDSPLPVMTTFAPA